MVYNLLSISEPVENLIDESYGYFPRFTSTYTKISCIMGEGARSTDHLKFIHEPLGYLSIVRGGGGGSVKAETPLQDLPGQVYLSSLISSHTPQV